MQRRGRQNPPRRSEMNAKMQSGQTIERLREAVNSVNLLAVQAILETQKPASIPVALARKAMVIAISRGGGEKLIKLLISAGADPNAPLDKSETFLWLAVSHRNSDAVQALLFAGADANAGSRMPPLWDAVVQGDLYVADLLLYAGARINLTGPQGANMLHMAAELGHIGLVQRLIEAGIPIDGRDLEGSTALNYALRTHGDRQQMVSTLIEHGADVNARRVSGTTAAMIAGYLGQFDTFDRLIAAGADPLAHDNEGCNVFTAALQLGSDATALALLERHPELIAAREDLDAALVAAVRVGCIPAVEMLVQKGADLGQRPGGRTLVQCAPPKADKLKRMLRSLKIGAAVDSAMDGPGEASPAPTHSTPTL